MRRLILTGMALAIASLGVAQETLASRNPVQTVGGYSAHRYVSEPATLPPGGIDSPIPLCETKRILDELVESMVLSKNVEAWVDEALGTVMTLNKEDVAVSFIELCRESNGPPHLGSFQGDIPMYASGASKVVYAIALGHKLQQNNGRVGGKMRSDLHAMLADGSAEATNRIVDAVSGTESGDELSGGDFRSFTKKRNYANWMFQCVGFQNFNVNQKMWVGDPSPRDLQLLGAKQNLNYANSNRMTSNQAAALLFLLNENAVISSKFSCQLKDDMTRQVTQVKRGNLSGIAAGLPARLAHGRHPGLHEAGLQRHRAGHAAQRALVHPGGDDPLQRDADQLRAQPQPHRLPPHDDQDGRRPHLRRRLPRSSACRNPLGAPASGRATDLPQITIREAPRASRISFFGDP